MCITQCLGNLVLWVRALYKTSILLVVVTVTHNPKAHHTVRNHRYKLSQAIIKCVPFLHGEAFRAGAGVSFGKCLKKKIIMRTHYVYAYYAINK